MGFRFRKSIKYGPFRITATKSGISASVGVKGARISKTASGKTTTTLSIPGTGISYVSTFGKKKTKRRNNHTERDAHFLVMFVMAIYAAIIAFFVWAGKSIVSLIAWLISSDKENIESAPAPTENEPALTESRPELTEAELIPAAIEIVVEEGTASTSLLQRKLRVGYARAARLIDEMERMGIVGPFEGSKPRQVILSKEKYLSLRDSGAFEPE